MKWALINISFVLTGFGHSFENRVPSCIQSSCAPQEYTQHTSYHHIYPPAENPITHEFFIPLLFFCELIQYSCYTKKRFTGVNRCKQTNQRKNIITWDANVFLQTSFFLLLTIFLLHIFHFIIICFLPISSHDILYLNNIPISLLISLLHLISTGHTHVVTQ